MSTIQDKSVVAFNYVLKDDNGEIVDQSNGAPLYYLHGANNIIPGLENALAGKTVGDKLAVSIPAGEAYGEYNPELIQEVPRDMFHGVADIQAGQQFQADDGEGGVQIVTVKDVSEQTVVIDANHPMAGKNLNFEVEVVEIRDATQEELLHGHVHGNGGVHH